MKPAKISACAVAALVAVALVATAGPMPVSRGDIVAPSRSDEAVQVHYRSYRHRHDRHYVGHRRWVPGHYASYRHHRHWVPGHYVYGYRGRYAYRAPNPVGAAAGTAAGLAGVGVNTAVGTARVLGHGWCDFWGYCR